MRILCGAALMGGLFGCSGKPPADRGVHDGRLFPCPAKPNCVSSLSTERRHAVEPIVYTVSREQAVDRLAGILEKMEGVEIRERSGEYIWAECTSQLMRFVDDLEFHFPEREQVIHLRSASRVGYSDLGVNRKRVEQIRDRFVTETTEEKR